MTRKHLLLLASLILYCLAISGKDSKKYFKPQLINDQLEEPVVESSGLLWDHNVFWTFNDGGNDPCLYALSENGKYIVKTLCVSNVRNNDWEAITKDDQYVYIGDVGNNKGHRKTLFIYKFKRQYLLQSETEVKADIIEFSYNNENKHNDRRFDCEAITSIGDSLYLFNKNWEDSYCFIYAIPKNAGKYELKPIKKIFLEGLVTDAAYNENTGSLILIGYRDFIPFVYFIKKFNHNSIKTKKARRFDYRSLIGLQTEGICFVNDSTVVFSSEYSKVMPGSLYKIHVPVE